MLQVNGYKIQHTLRELQHRREMAATQFSEGTFIFADEVEQTMGAQEAFDIFYDCEEKIARLQVIQAEYNLKNMCVVQGKEMSLHEAVKRVGGAGRAEKMWRTATTSGRDRWERRERTRSKDDVRATRAVPIPKCMENAKVAARYASALREAIQIANGKTLDIPGEAGFADFFTA